MYDVFLSGKFISCKREQDLGPYTATNPSYEQEEKLSFKRTDL